MHQWIRSLEAILHLAYKLAIKRWKKNKKLGDDIIIEEKKHYIQDQCRERLGLLLDMPKPGGAGNTNDGNTARRLFQNYEIFSEITGVDQQLIFHLYVLNCVINCDFVCK